MWKRWGREAKREDKKGDKLLGKKGRGRREKKQVEEYPGKQVEKARRKEDVTKIGKRRQIMKGKTVIN